MNPNTKCNHFPIHHYVRIYTRHLKTTGCMLMFWISNDYSTIGDVYFLFCALAVDARYKWRVTPANTHCSIFLISHFCTYSVLTYITQILQVICGRSAYRTTSIISKTFFVWFRVALKIRLESYGSSYASVVLWYYHATLHVCIYCKTIYTALIGTQLRLTTKVTGLTIGYYTTNNGLTANDASLNFQCWLATLYVAVCRYVYTNFSRYVVLILAGTCTTVPLYEFAAKQPKKNIN